MNQEEKKELERKINIFWYRYITTQARADERQAEADYYKKLHDIAVRELEDLEKYGND